MAPSDRAMVRRLQRLLHHQHQSSRLNKYICFVELFPGQAGVTKRLRTRGYAALGFDVLGGPHFDQELPVM